MPPPLLKSQATRVFLPILEKDGESRMNDCFLDEDGYPTNKTLEIIRTMNAIDEAKAQELFRLVQSLWWYGTMKETKPGLWVCATAGWSGNESLMNSVLDNASLRAYSYMMYVSGGLFVFAISKEAKEEFERFIRNKLLKWAWNS